MFKKKYYKSLNTLPIFNFEQCKKGEYQYLLIGNIDDLPEKYPPSFVSIFMDMLFELEHANTDMVHTLYRIAKYDNKFAQTKEGKWKVKRDLLQYEYDQKLKDKSESKQDFFTQVGIVEKFMKREINVYTCPTNKYLGYVHMLEVSNG